MLDFILKSRDQSKIRKGKKLRASQRQLRISENSYHA
jgi:hypothetical protein